MEGYKLLRAIEQCQVNISSIFLTSASKENTAAIPEIIQNFGSIPVYMNELERPLFDKSMKSVAHGTDEAGSSRIPNVQMDIQYLKDNAAVSAAGHAVRLESLLEDRALPFTRPATRLDRCATISDTSSSPARPSCATSSARPRVSRRSAGEWSR